MKTNLSGSTVLRNRWRGGVTLLAFLLIISFGITEGVAQSRNKNEKRITSLQIGQRAEGSRVTIVADSSMNDYEAFRRGDRFYVRIPLANFIAAQPGFRGDGFEDVQVQKVGDSVVVSFKLQPGATARVDQRSNRLEVIFFSSNRMARNNTVNSIPSLVSPSATIVTNRTNDAAVVAEANAERPNDGQPTLGRSTQTSTADPANRAGNNGSISSGEPSQVDSSDSAAAPTYSIPTIATPSVTEPSKSLTAPLTTRWSNWKARGVTAVQWVSANRLASLPGSFTLLALIGLLAFFVNNRRKNVGKAKRERTPGVQPTYTAGLELEDMLAGRASDPVSNVDSVSFVDELATRQPSEQPAAPAPVVQPDFSGARVARASGRAMAAAVVAKPQSQWILTRPPMTPSMSGVHKVSEAQEREVFEL